MDMDQTDAQFKYWAQQVGIALNTKMGYVLREMSSVGPIGMPGVSDTHGAALWTLNFFLYAATLQISSVQMHMTANSNASAWQPIPMYGSATTFVRPQYYAHAAVAQLIGNGNGTTQFAQVSTGGVSSEYTGRIRTYTSYANDKLQAVIMINSKPLDSSEESSAGSFTFNFNLGSVNANKDVYVSYLTAPGSDSQQGVTWNGMSYDDITGHSSLVDNTVVLTTADSQGRIQIPVRDSQAAVANIGWQLGVNPVLKPDPSITKKSNGGSTTRGSANVWAAMAAMLVALGMVFAA